MTDYRLTNLGTQEHQDYMNLTGGLRALHLLEVPYIALEQAPGETFNQACTAACGVSIIRAYQRKDTVHHPDVLEKMKSDNASELIPDRLQKALLAHGIESRWETGLSLFDFFMRLRANKPLVVLFDFKRVEPESLPYDPGVETARFVVLVGMDNSQACIHDPAAPAEGGSALCLPLAQFESGMESGLDGGGTYSALIPVHGINDPAVLDGPLYRVRTRFKLNIRSGPSTAFADIGDIPSGVEKEIFEEDLNGLFGRIAFGQWMSINPDHVERLSDSTSDEQTSGEHSEPAGPAPGEQKSTSTNQPQTGSGTGTTAEPQDDTHTGTPAPAPDALYHVRVINPINVRSGPSMNTSDVGNMSPGDVAAILEENTHKTYGRIGPNRWITLSTTYVRRVDPSSLGERALAPAEAMEVLYRVRVMRGIHIRSGPSINTTDVGDMAPGDECDILAENPKKTYGKIASNRWITLNRAYVKKI